MGHTPVGEKYKLDVGRASRYGRISGKQRPQLDMATYRGHCWGRCNSCISETHLERREPQVHEEYDW